MKLMLKFSIPVEKGNMAAADGSMTEALNKLKNDVHAEAVYLFLDHGKRSGIVIFDESDSARMPAMRLLMLKLK